LKTKKDTGQYSSLPHSPKKPQSKSQSNLSLQSTTLNNYS